MINGDFSSVEVMSSLWYFEGRRHIPWCCGDAKGIRAIRRLTYGITHGPFVELLGTGILAL